MLITLIGYRGTGKTTVAQLLADQYGVPWWDSDIEIESRAGATIREIFAEQGESVFRDLEEAVIRDLAEHERGVLAVGGGAVLRESNRAAIGRGRVFWLDADAETIFQRLAADPTTAARRPRLTDAPGLTEIRTLMDAREPLYRRCADRRIVTNGRTPAEVAAEIACSLG